MTKPAPHPVRAPAEERDYPHNRAWVVVQRASELPAISVSGASSASASARARMQRAS